MKQFFCACKQLILSLTDLYLKVKCSIIKLGRVGKVSKNTNVIKLTTKKVTVKCFMFFELSWE